MPHLWMFLLQSLTPTGHEVLLIDGNTHPMTDPELVEFAVRSEIGLVGIGAMTRMIAKAYRVADALRAAGIPVVMGGPHVTECPDEALGRDGGPRHADAIALGEADETWPKIVADAASGKLKEVYTPVDAFGQGTQTESLQDYPAIPWRSRLRWGSSIASRNSSAPSWSTSSTVGRPSISSRSNPGADAHTVANSARSRGSSEIPFASVPTRASWMRCCG